jgi:hypothetical protein
MEKTLARRKLKAIEFCKIRYFLTDYQKTNPNSSADHSTVCIFFSRENVYLMARLFLTIDVFPIGLGGKFAKP